MAERTARADTLIDLRDEPSPVPPRVHTGVVLIARGELVLSITNEERVRVDASCEPALAARLEVGGHVEVLLDGPAFERVAAVPGTILHVGERMVDAHGQACRVVSIEIALRAAPCAGA